MSRRIAKPMIRSDDGAGDRVQLQDSEGGLGESLTDGGGGQVGGEALEVEERGDRLRVRPGVERELPPEPRPAGGDTGWFFSENQPTSAPSL